MFVHEGLLPDGCEDYFLKMVVTAHVSQQKNPDEDRGHDAHGTGAREEACRRTEQEEEVPKSLDQFVHTRRRLLKNSCTRLAVMAFSGPIARQNAEQAEKAQWLSQLAVLLTAAPTPFGAHFVTQPSAGISITTSLRPATLGNRARTLRQFSWLAQAHGANFPTDDDHVLQYQKLKVVEPCTRNVFKVVH